MLFLLSKPPRCILPSFESNGLSVQKKKRKIDSHISGHGGHPGFPISRILAIVLSTSHSDASYQVSNQLASLVQQKKRKIDFQDGHYGGHPGYQIGKISAIFDL